MSLASGRPPVFTPGLSPRGFQGRWHLWRGKSGVLRQSQPPTAGSLFLGAPSNVADGGWVNPAVGCIFRHYNRPPVMKDERWPSFSSLI